MVAYFDLLFFNWYLCVSCAVTPQATCAGFCGGKSPAKGRCGQPRPRAQRRPGVGRRPEGPGALTGGEPCVAAPAQPPPAPSGRPPSRPGRRGSGTAPRRARPAAAGRPRPLRGQGGGGRGGSPPALGLAPVPAEPQEEGGRKLRGAGAAGPRSLGGLRTHLATRAEGHSPPSTFTSARLPPFSPFELSWV